MPPAQNPQNPLNPAPTAPTQPVAPGSSPPEPTPAHNWNGTAQPLPAGTQPPASQPTVSPTQSTPLYRPAPTHSPDQSSSRYDFFLQEQPKPKKTLIPRRAGMSNFNKILLLAAAVFGIIIILAVVLSLVRSNSAGSSANLLGIAQNQQEIIRVNTAGLDVLHAESLVNFATTAVSTTTSSQNELTAYMRTRGIGIGKGQLDATKNSRTDQVLVAAESANNYDTTFRSTMGAMLKEYLARLKTSLSRSRLQSERDILEKNITSTTLLQQMLGQ